MILPRKIDCVGDTMNSPVEGYTRSQTLQDLTDAHNRNGLIELQRDLQSQIDECDWGLAWESFARYRLSILNDAIESL